MFISALLLLVLFTILIFDICKWNKIPLPPGERGLPVVGYWPFLKKRFTETADLLYRKHGDLFHIRIGSRTVVLVANYQKVKELFSKTELADRPSLFSMKLFNGSRHLGILSSKGKIWETNRKFAIRTLSEFGFGKSKLEDLILEEVKELVQNLEQGVDHPTTIDWELNVAVLNVIWRVVADKRYELEDPEMKQFFKYINDNLEDLDAELLIFNYFAWLEPLFPNIIKRNFMRMSSVEKRRSEIKKFLIEKINEHKRTINRSSPRDFIDKYLIEKEIKANNSKFSHFGDEDLSVTLLNLFVAGSETTSSTIRWCFAYMAKYVDVQNMVQRQIDSVVPKDRLPTIEDKESLPLLQALINELCRVVSVLPTALTHEASEDIAVDEYIIPKGAIVLPYLEKCNTDPNYWERPNELYLGHFLDSERRFVKREESFIPFSTGSRLCLGKALATMELYLFIGAILQKFEIRGTESQDVYLGPRETLSLLNTSTDFQVVMKKRI